MPEGILVQEIHTGATSGMAHAKAPPHPWEVEPVWRTFARESRYIWPFWVGFAVTGIILYKISSAVTDEEVEKSSLSRGSRH
jgi:hypothetical protein